MDGRFTCQHCGFRAKRYMPGMLSCDACWWAKVTTLGHGVALPRWVLCDDGCWELRKTNGTFYGRIERRGASYVAVHVHGVETVRRSLHAAARDLLGLL